KVNQEFHLKEIESALRRNIDSIWVKNAGISLPNATEEAVYLSSDGDPILFSENNSEMMLDRFNVNVEAVRSNPAELKSIFTELIFGYLTYDERDLDTTLLKNEIQREITLKRLG